MHGHISVSLSALSSEDNAGAGVIVCGSLGKGAGVNRVICFIWSLGRWLIPNGIDTRNVPGDVHNTAYTCGENSRARLVSARPLRESLSSG
jgi:hypothetical protein